MADGYGYLIVAEWLNGGKPLVMFGTHQDITDRKVQSWDLKLTPT